MEDAHKTRQALVGMKLVGWGHVGPLWCVCERVVALLPQLKVKVTMSGSQSSGAPCAHRGVSWTWPRQRCAEGRAAAAEWCPPIKKVPFSHRSSPSFSPPLPLLPPSSTSISSQETKAVLFVLRIKVLNIRPVKTWDNPGANKLCVCEAANYQPSSTSGLIHCHPAPPPAFLITPLSSTARFLFSFFWCLGSRCILKIMLIFCQALFYCQECKCPRYFHKIFFYPLPLFIENFPAVRCFCQMWRESWTGAEKAEEDGSGSRSHAGAGTALLC